MRIRSPLLTKLIATVVFAIFRVWMGTLRCRFRYADPAVEPKRADDGRRFIYAVWHETMLLPVYSHGHRGMHMLISRHQDGEYLAQVARAMRVRIVRGSTARRGGAAVRQLLARSRNRGFRLALTPDGPRGPRRQVQPGVIYLASRTGLPIVPVGAAFRRPWRLGSWDRFAVPKPFSLAICLIGRPVHVPQKLDRKGLEQYRCRIEAIMHELTRRAERWAEHPLERPESRVESLATH